MRLRADRRGSLIRFLIRQEKDAQCIGSAVGGDSTAGFGDMDFRKIAVFQDRISHIFDQ